jgi:hypothetical protein
MMSMLLSKQRTAHHQQKVLYVNGPFKDQMWTLITLKYVDFVAFWENSVSSPTQIWAVIQALVEAVTVFRSKEQTNLQVNLLSRTIFISLYVKPLKSSSQLTQPLSYLPPQYSWSLTIVVKYLKQSQEK